MVPVAAAGELVAAGAERGREAAAQAGVVPVAAEPRRKPAAAGVE